MAVRVGTSRALSSRRIARFNMCVLLFLLYPHCIETNARFASKRSDCLLMIARTVSELIDALLVNGEPVGDSQFLPHKLPEGADIVSLAVHMYPPVCSSTQIP